VTPSLAALYVSGTMFVGMLFFLEIGRRIGQRRFSRDPEGLRAGVGAVEGALFGLLGLLIAFTFSGAAQRFDERRKLIADEANAIGTAWLRVDLLPASEQPKVRDLFRVYLDTRLETYGKLLHEESSAVMLEKASKLQGEIWTRSVSGCRSLETPAATMLLLPALNEMIDITTTREMATQMHPPSIIFAMLVALALSAALLAGYGMAGTKGRSWIHVLSFVAVLSLSVYVILDLEYPRLGLIRIDAADQVLRDLRRSMG
jgi:hypothetical protein